MTPILQATQGVSTTDFYLSPASADMLNTQFMVSSTLGGLQLAFLVALFTVIIFKRR